MKSVVTMVRRQLGYKGKTQHNGRGGYDMQLPKGTKWMELHGRAFDLFHKWEKEGIVESSVINPVKIEVIFKKNIGFDEYYRGWMVRKDDVESQWCAMVVFMVIK